MGALLDLAHGRSRDAMAWASAPEPGEWSGQQDQALRMVRSWIKDPYGKQVFRLFGYAGTGKTTLAQEIARMVKGLVLYATFTGKAALVLRKKGCHSASTIHALIYEPVQCERTGEVTFKLKVDSDLADAKILIVDEVSMVDELLGSDLVSYGTRILVLGDPMQLKPIKGQGYFTNGEPDIMLTEVHRQAEGNPIIRLSMDVREGGRLMPGQYGDSLIVRREDIDREELGAKVTESDQLICGLNRTRHNFNRRIRQMRGLHGRQQPWHPAAGDRLICLKNNHHRGLFNGGMWHAANVKVKKGVVNVIAESLDEERAPITAKVFDEFWTGDEQKLDWRERKKSDEFTFGWAITCHKAQGSQYDNPIIFDESGTFARGGEHINWTYTAITRAAERLTIIL